MSSLGQNSASGIFTPSNRIYSRDHMTYANSNIQFKENKSKYLDESLRFISSKLDHTQLIKLDAELSSHMALLDRSSLLSVSDLKGNIIFANENFCEVSKYTMEELIGKPHSIVRHPNTPASVFKEMWNTIGSGNIWQGEIQNLAKDGSSYWVIATVVPVIGENGKPVKYISMRVDITKQKMIEEELIEAKRKIDDELHDNINYGKYVHDSFLTPMTEIRSVFPESFLIYKAQKIISGDFYRFQKYGNSSTLVLGDSTGHGISASYISIIILNILTRILRSDSSNPSKILEVMYREMLRNINSSTRNPLMESADMIVCCFDLDDMQLNYASSNMRGCLIRDGEMTELKKEKCSLSHLLKKDVKIANNEVKLKKGDLIYLFTDGILDQFGGPMNKKFSNQKLSDLLIKNSELPMAMQKKHIKDELIKWQGDHNQTDDVTVIGLKIP